MADALLISRDLSLIIYLFILSITGTYLSVLIKSSHSSDMNNQNSKCLLIKYTYSKINPLI